MNKYDVICKQPNLIEDTHKNYSNLFPGLQTVSAEFSLQFWKIYVENYAILCGNYIKKKKLSSTLLF